MVKYLAILLTPLVFLAVACSDDKGTATPPEVASPTATARPPGTLPPVDGTVDPLGFGGTDPVTIKSNPDPISAIAVLRDVRIGAHPEQGGWDRIVFEFAGVLPAGDARYERQIVQCGSGMPVQLPGSAALFVRFEPAQAHNDAGQPTVRAQQITGPGNVILEARSACDFEAHVNWAIALRSQQRFKVTTLQNPTRVVIDVKWP